MTKPLRFGEIPEEGRKLLEERYRRKGSLKPGENPFSRLFAELDVAQVKGSRKSEPRWNGGYSPLSEALKHVSPAQMVIRDILPASGITFLLAEFSVGKTLLILDQGLHIATDKDWLGMPTAKGRHVIYLAGEDEGNALRNAQAWYRHHGIKEDDPTVRFIFYPHIVNLLDEADCRAFIADIRKRLPVSEPGPVIYIDTWQRAVSEASQNDDDQMQVAIKNAEMIGRELHAAIVIAAHPPKGNSSTIAGSGVMQNASTAIWRLLIDGKKDGSLANAKHSFGRKFLVDRIKGAAAGYQRHLRREVIELDGKDAWGDPLKGAYLVDDHPTQTLQTMTVDTGPQLDTRERRIFASIGKDPSMSYAKRAQELDIAETTLKSAVERLVEKGVVRKGNGGKLEVVE